MGGVGRQREGEREQQRAGWEEGGEGVHERVLLVKPIPM